MQDFGLPDGSQVGPAGWGGPAAEGAEGAGRRVGSLGSVVSTELRRLAQAWPAAAAVADEAEQLALSRQMVRLWLGGRTSICGSTLGIFFSFIFYLNFCLSLQIVTQLGTHTSVGLLTIQRFRQI